MTWCQTLRVWTSCVEPSFILTFHPGLFPAGRWVITPSPQCGRVGWSLKGPQDGGKLCSPQGSASLCGFQTESDLGVGGVRKEALGEDLTSSLGSWLSIFKSSWLSPLNLHFVHLGLILAPHLAHARVLTSGLWHARKMLHHCTPFTQFLVF